MRILFLSAWCPFPADNGSKLRIAHLLRGLAVHHDIDLLAFAPDSPCPATLHTLGSICNDVHLLPETPFAGRASGHIWGLFSSKPRSVVANYSVAMEQAVRARSNRRYDLVIASQLHMAPYALLLPHIPRILEEVELAIIYEQYARQRQLFRRVRAALTWVKTCRYIRALLRHFSGATVASIQECDLLRPLLSEALPLAVVPNGVDIAACAGNYGEPEPDVLVYPGAISYHANFDAVAYFITAVLPYIHAQRPQVRLRVTGHAAPDRIAALPPSRAVEFTGYLADVRPAVAQAWAEVVPLRVGGGTRLKVLEALALGTPVVATSKGIEGLSLESGRDLLVADAPETFANQTLRLLESETLRQELALYGRRAAAAYDWSTSVERLNDLVIQCTYTSFLGKRKQSVAAPHYSLANAKDESR